MYHQSIYQAERELKDWVARHLPILSEDAQSADAADMVISLGRLMRFTQIQLSAMAEQWSQDKWAERNRVSEDQM